MSEQYKLKSLGEGQTMTFDRTAFGAATGVYSGSDETFRTITKMGDIYTYARLEITPAVTPYICIYTSENMVDWVGLYQILLGHAVIDSNNYPICINDDTYVYVALIEDNGGAIEFNVYRSSDSVTFTKWKSVTTLAHWNIFDLFIIDGVVYAHIYNGTGNGFINMNTPSAALIDTYTPYLHKYATNCGFVEDSLYYFYHCEVTTYDVVLMSFDGTTIVEKARWTEENWGKSDNTGSYPHPRFYNRGMFLYNDTMIALEYYPFCLTRIVTYPNFLLFGSLIEENRWGTYTSTKDIVAVRKEDNEQQAKYITSFRNDTKWNIAEIGRQGRILKREVIDRTIYAFCGYNDYIIDCAGIEVFKFDMHNGLLLASGSSEFKPNQLILKYQLLDHHECLINVNKEDFSIARGQHLHIYEEEYEFQDNFKSTPEGQEPIDWLVDSTPTNGIVEVETEGGRDDVLRLYSNGTRACYASYHELALTTNDCYMEFDVFVSAYGSRYNNKIGAANGSLIANVETWFWIFDGYIECQTTAGFVQITPVSVDTWYTIKVLPNLTSNTFQIWVDDIYRGEYAPLGVLASATYYGPYFQEQSNPGTMLIDNVKVFRYDEKIDGYFDLSESDPTYGVYKLFDKFYYDLNKKITKNFSDKSHLQLNYLSDFQFDFLEFTLADDSYVSWSQNVTDMIGKDVIKIIQDHEYKLFQIERDRTVDFISSPLGGAAVATYDKSNIISSPKVIFESYEISKVILTSKFDSSGIPVSATWSNTENIMGSDNILYDDVPSIGSQSELQLQANKIGDQLKNQVAVYSFEVKAALVEVGDCVECCYGISDIGSDDVDGNPDVYDKCLVRSVREIDYKRIYVELVSAFVFKQHINDRQAVLSQINEQRIAQLGTSLQQGDITFDKLQVTGNPTDGDGVGNRDYNDARYSATGSAYSDADAVTAIQTANIDYTDVKVEAVIDAELVNGQSIDTAIDALILTHKNITDAHHAKYTDAEVEALSINALSEDPSPALSADLNLGAHGITSTDADKAFYFGRAKITSLEADYASFSHRDFITPSEAALFQKSSGEVCLGAGSATEVNIQNENDPVITVSSAGVDFNNKQVSGPLDPTADTHIGDRAYNDGRYVAGTDLTDHIADIATHGVAGTIADISDITSSITTHKNIDDAHHAPVSVSLPISLAIQALSILNSDGGTIGFFSTDGTMSSDSDLKGSTEKAIKKYVDDQFAGAGYTDSEAVQAVEDAGLALLTTKVYSSADEDAKHYFGRAGVGYAGSWCDYAAFGHRDLMSDEEAVALIQRNDGAITNLQAAESGGQINLKIDGSTILSISKTEMRCNSKILSGTLDPTDGDEIGDRDYNDARYVQPADLDAYGDEKSLIINGMYQANWTFTRRSDNTSSQTYYFIVPLPAGAKITRVNFFYISNGNASTTIYLRKQRHYSTESTIYSTTDSTPNSVRSWNHTDYTVEADYYAFYQMTMARTNGSYTHVYPIKVYYQLPVGN